MLLCDDSCLLCATQGDLLDHDQDSHGSSLVQATVRLGSQALDVSLKQAEPAVPLSAVKRSISCGLCQDLTACSLVCTSAAAAVHCMIRACSM